MSLFVMILALCLVAPSALAERAIETRTVRFAPGASSAVLQGQLKGYAIVDYRLRARAGQTMSVRLTSDNLSNYFNVLPPGSRDVALFIGSVSGNTWRGPLAEGGDYRIRLYLMRSAARRNETAEYRLEVAIENAPVPAASRDARVGDTPYHAVGQVPCSVGTEPGGASRCDFGVIRRPGRAEVQLTLPDGTRRILYFSGERVSADGGREVQAERHGDQWSVDVGEREHYRLPEAVISGG